MSRALIVSGSEKAMETLAQFLLAYGYNDLTSAASGGEVRRLMNSQEYGLIVVNSPLTDEFGHELSIVLAEKTSSGIILLCKADIADDVSDKVADYGVCVVSRPINKSILHQSLRLVEATRSRVLGLKQENSKLMVKLDEMRHINRAKFMLMQHQGLPEPEAHRYIEKQAMDTRSTRKDVALRILSMYES